MNIPKTHAGIAALAKKELKKKDKKVRVKGFTAFREGDAMDKTWENFQVTKKLKREFADVAKKQRLNRSKYLRTCVEIFVSSDGDMKKIKRKLANYNKETTEKYTKKLKTEVQKLEQRIEELKEQTEL